MSGFLIVKYLLTLFVAILIPVYWKNYGVKNFLWLSDIGLFLTLLAVWFHSALLISIAMILVFPLEIIWNIDFFFNLITKRKLLNIVDYMFDPKYSLFLRSLSLFHTFLPIFWIWSLFAWGYDKNALGYGIIIVWIVLSLSYFFTDPKENINWVFLPMAYHWRKIPAFLWFIFLLIGFPLFILAPMHFILQYLFK
jgi:hypothetical protein